MNCFLYEGRFWFMTPACFLSSRSEIYCKRKGGLTWLGKVSVPLLVVHFIIVCCGAGMNISEAYTVFYLFLHLGCKQCWTSPGSQVFACCQTTLFTVHKPLWAYMRTEFCHHHYLFLSRTLHLFLVQWWTDEGITNNNVKLEDLYCWCVNHQKGIFVSLQPLQTNNNSSCMFQSVNKLMLNCHALIGFMDLLVVVLNVIHNALHMHFWCYRKIEQAYSLHFPSPQEPSLLLVFSLRELIGLNVAEWSAVFFPSLSYFLVGVMRAHKSLMLFCCCYLEGPVRSIGDRREDNQDKDKPRKVRSLLPQGPCTCEVYQQKTCLRPQPH